MNFAALNLRSEVLRGSWPAIAVALLLSVAACAPPKVAREQTPTPQSPSTSSTPITQSPSASANPITQSPSASPAQITHSPSASPTPITAFGASSPGFHAGEVGVLYAPVQLTATGGVKPYKWTVQAGALPPGVQLGADGAVSGTPTASGIWVFSIQAADSASGTATITDKIDVATRLSATLIPSCAASCNVELGCASACGGFGQVGGGLAPYSYSVVQGPLPAGTSLSTSSAALIGTFAGLPGYLKFTVQVRDAFGATATLSPTFWMYPHISVASGGCSVNYGMPCTTQLKISGGIPNDHFAVTLVADGPPGQTQGCGSPGPAPAGSLGVSGDVVVVDVPGVWPSASGYGAIWTIRVTDSALCAPSTYCASNDAKVVVEVQCG